MTDETVAVRRPPAEEILVIAEMDPTRARQVQRRAKDGHLQRLAPGIYGPTGSDEETVALVRRNWQRMAGALVPGAVVSHASALTRGLQADGTVTLSHPTIYNKRIALPGVTLVMLKGPGRLPDDLQLSAPNLIWASRPRYLLENLGKKSPRRAGTEEVEQKLVDILNASGEEMLNRVRDDARAIAPAMGAERAAETLNKMIGALLGTHARGELKTHSGRLVAAGIPVDRARHERFDQLATHLRTASLPVIQDVAPGGVARMNFAFIEAYFSNYVEGTKFDIGQAEGIALRNEIVANRPKDSHDILGVFRLAQTAPYRNAPPPPGDEFLPALQDWHAQMLARRPESEPGQIKTEVNFAGTSQFVDPGMVRGTFVECSRMALSVPEGLARAIFYGFLVTEIHPFVDGNGRISRLLMNAELSRLGLCRVIIPTLYHPQYVDCAKQLSTHNDPTGYVSAIAKMARWCAQFDYSDLPRLVQAVRATNALEESARHP